MLLSYGEEEARLGMLPLMIVSQQRRYFWLWFNREFSFTKAEEIF